ncbi:hypothetical protein EAO71_23170 [Streptomyces sp. ms191]|uniref:hypothetical protein n=1 Tax=unclassified Streptomyces TaxID=2593676 RepID=UPI0011CDB8B2|nr:hypothetical protein [Streptomyces sp. ms191]TXS22805.1 hypothetical protein EAO71_23170 [Streptomyces sp. ms191]
MAAHAAVPARRHLSTHGFGLPVTLGLAYGIYAAAIPRDGGVLTWGLVLLGVVSGLVLAAGVYALRRWGHVIPREPHAAAWGALAGIAIGFLYSLSDSSIWSATVLGLVVGACITLAAFYLLYTHEDVPRRPVRRTP